MAPVTLAVWVDGVVGVQLWRLLSGKVDLQREEVVFRVRRDAAGYINGLFAVNERRAI